MKENKILRNAIRTPDGTVLESNHRHDYKEHRDANGKLYMVDGGLEYLRRTTNGDEVDLSVTSDAPHDVVRELAIWGTYGKEGDEPYRLISAAEMETGHLLAVTKNQPNLYPQVKDVMLDELLYRGVDFEDGRGESK